MHRRHKVIALLVASLLGLVIACEGDSADSPESPEPEQQRQGGRDVPVTVVPPHKTGHQQPVPWSTRPARFRSPEVYDGLLQPTGPATKRPNVVLITTDDQTLEEMSAMPKTRELFAKSGVTFDEGLAPNPLCCPARAQILTGQFSHNNGVRSNSWPHGGYYALDSDNTLPVWLHRAGYRTAFLGKYLNEYGWANPREIPPGWDVWKGAAYRKHRTYDYYNVVLNENGKLRRYPRSYQTDLYADMSVGLIERFAKSDRPFFLWQSHVAPHRGCRSQFGWQGPTCWHPPDPAARHIGDFANAQLPQRSDPSYNEKDIGDKPPRVRDNPPLSDKQKRQYTELAQLRAASLKAVDDAVIRTTAALDKANILDETIIIVTSDNGFLLGEHRVFGKDIGYELAVRVPLLMRGPGIPSGIATDQVGTLVDLAPTIMAAAGAEPGLKMDGRNLLPVMRGNKPGWNTVLLQGGPHARNDTAKWRFLGARSSRYTYLELPQTGAVELYDRKRDPYQLRNVAGAAAYDPVQREMKRRLDALRDCAAATCRRDFGPEPVPRNEARRPPRAQPPASDTAPVNPRRRGS